METRGLFKRIAAITMAALTIVTSSGVDVNLLTANANELTKQATENAVDENTNKVLQKKDAKVGAQAKLSFSTNDALKRAVDDAGFNIDVKTNEVKTAAIKYNQSLLTLGKDFTATAKRTSYTKNGSKYNYVFTVTVTGKGDYTGSTTRTGVTQVSDIKPATAKKKAKKASAKKSTAKKTPKKTDSDTDSNILNIEAQTKNASDNIVDKDGTGKDMHGWQITFNDDYHSLVKTDSDLYRVTYFDHNNREQFSDPQVTATFTVKEKTGEHTYTMNASYLLNNEAPVPSQNGNGGYGKNTGKIEIKTNENFQNKVKANIANDADISKIGGVIITYDTWKSCIQDGGYSFTLRTSQTATQHNVTFDTRNGVAANDFEFTGQAVKPQVWLTTTTTGQSSTEEQIGGNNGQVAYSGNSDNPKVNDKCIVTVTMPNRMHSEKIDITYSIGPRTLTSDMISVADNLTYNSTAQEPTVTVKYGNDKIPQKESDGTENYTVAYRNNMNATTDSSKATVTVTGTGNYTGTITKEFDIAPRNAVNADKNDVDTANGMKLEGLSGVYAGGDAVKPKPVITYSPSGVTEKDKDGKSQQKVITLTEGTDYTISYKNNTALTTSSMSADEKPQATIKFQGNYSGELTKTFEITQGSITSAGTVVKLGDQSYTISDKDTAQSGSVTIPLDAGFSTVFDPITAEEPQFSVIVGGKTLTLDTDYKVTGPTSSDANTTHKWPSATGDNWNWKTTLEGKKGGNYSGTITVNFKVTPLDVSSMVVKSASIDDSRKATVTFTYTSPQTNHTLDVETDSDNFDISVPSTAVGANIPISVSGKGNYTGTTTATAGRGLDINTASTEDGPLKIMYFDPYTGKQIPDAGAMQYYGDNVVPKVILLKGTKSTQNGGSGNWTYTQIPEDYYNVTSRGVITDPNDSSGRVMLLNIQTRTNNEIYGSISEDSPLSQIRITQLDLSRAYSDGKVSFGSDGKQITSGETGDIKVTPDNSALTTYTKTSTIQEQLKLYVKPKNVGQTVTAKLASNTSASDGTVTYNDSSSPKITWTAPDYWDTESTIYGTELTYGKQNFTLKGETLDKDKKTVVARGTAPLYTGQYMVHLDQVDISKSDDFVIQPDPQETYAWNGKPLFPKVRLHQKSTNWNVPGIYYYVIYTDSQGNRYVLSSDKNGKAVDADTAKASSDGSTKDRNAWTEVGSTNVVITGETKYEQTDPTATVDQDTNTNYASVFANEGTYRIDIRMKTNSDNKSKLSGDTTDTLGEENYKGKTYQIKKQSVNDKINAYFRPKTVSYLGFSDGGTAETPAPELSGNKDTAAKQGGTKLWVKGVGSESNTDLNKDTDYTVDKTASDEYFTYPGEKHVTVTGLGAYAGTSDVTYTVKGDLKNLSNPKYFTFTIGNTTITKSDRITIYTNGTDGFVTESGDPFSLSDISISIPNTSEVLERDADYKLAQNTITGTGNQTIRIDGVSAGYVNTHYDLLLNVVDSRSGLTWNKNNSDKIELKWTGSAYKLGEGDLALKSGYTDGTVTLKSGDDDVTVNGKQPNPDTVYPTFTDPGSYSIVITGPSGTGQTSKLTLDIKYDLSQATVNLGFESPYQYNGTDPYDASKVKVTIGTTELTSGTDYTLDAGNHSANAGSYSVAVGSTSTSKNFSSETDDPIKVNYVITPISLSSNMTATDIGSIGTYTGKEITVDNSKFTGHVTYTKDDGTTTDPLTDTGTTFTVSYQGGRTNAGTRFYTLTITGNYTGTCSARFTIDPYNLEDHKDDLTVPDQTYQGPSHPVRPQSINLKGFDPLKINKDYTVTAESGNSVVTDDAYVSIKGTGNFTGTVENLKFTIDRIDITKTTIDVHDQTFSGSYFAPDRYIDVYIPIDGDPRGSRLVYNTDYTLEVTRTADGDGNSINEPIEPSEHLIDAGTYAVVVKAKSGSGLVKGGNSTAKILTVAPLDISSKDSEFSVAPAEWTGNEVKPAVLRGGVELDDDMYSVTYTSNVKACGTLEEMRQINSNYSESDLPTATIKGKGNYTGTITKHFTIGHPFSNVTVNVNGGRITYDGNSHEPTFTISYSNSKVDISKVKYITTYPTDTINAGSKTVLLAATDGALYGTKSFNYYIYPAAGNTWIVEFSSNSGLTMDSSGMYTTTYQGAAITPGVKAYLLGSDGARTEIPLKTSEVTYANNNAAGTASVTVKPNNYEGTKVLYFKIMGVDIGENNNIYIAFTDGINRRKYTGGAITPKLTVTYAGSQGTVNLTQDKDYSLTYENNTNAGAAKVKVTGIGNYSGTRDLPFSIWADLNDKTSTFTIPKQMYTGQPITELSGATIKAGGNDLKLGTDYKLSITSTDSFRTKGTAIFTAEGQYYEGTRTVQFDIGNDASMYNVLGVAATYVYDRQAHKPVPVITDKEGTVYPTDSVTYSSTSDGDTCVNAGYVRMQIVITSHGQTVTIPYNYQIQARDINTASMTPIADVDYNGKAHTPTIRITDGTHLLTGSPTSSDGSADFTYTYYNNVQPGIATVTINGINNYTGIANLYFSINVKEAPQMKVTAMPSGRLKVSWNKVSGVSGYRIFYAPQNGSQKQVNIGSSKKTTYLTGLTRGVLYTVGLQSYVRANGQNGYSSASVQQIATSTTQPKITSAKSTGKGKIKLTWKKVSNATAYMVYRKTSGSKKWTRVKTTKSTSFTNTGLKSGRNYTYKVISYKQSGVKRSFSKYSKGKTVIAK